MNKKSSFETANSTYGTHTHKDEIDSVIEHMENKIKKIHRRVSENEVKLESMESHSDYEYKDLLRELNEGEKDHKKDLKLFVDLLCKYRSSSE